ncbi:hypothetical protein BD410DRAFT_790049 [Rickenella mellea]|uniref:DUF7587 domain-containing protein n=1 Tax=Rickenella mellea TaxID=50990 RepID=A0A4Y7Q0V8_9AGAM|nr:hypothetical protein BD410DRAFT_790049 [Rickenella mellea]
MSHSNDATKPQKLLAFGFRDGPHQRPVESFPNVVREHPFLFRVNHEKSYVRYTEDVGYTAHRYHSGRTSHSPASDYAKVAKDNSKLARAVYRHLRNEGTNPFSPFISVTFNLAWALSRAALLCNRQEGDVEIAIINCSKVSPKSFFALEILHDCIEKDAIELRRRANAAQEVLVPVEIIPEAIIAQVPWKTLEENKFVIPRWFLDTGCQIDGPDQFVSTQEFIKDTRWMFTKKNITHEEAARDAVTFAFALLEPWVQRQGIFPWLPSMADKHQRIIRIVSSVAFDVVRWPSLEFPYMPCSAQRWDLSVVKRITESLVRRMLSQVECRSILAIIGLRSR